MQKHLQLRIEAQGKYMQNILDKACQTLAGENPTLSTAGGFYKTMVNNQETPVNMQGAGLVKDFGSPLSFPSFQDLNIYGPSGTDQIDHQLHGMQDRPLLIDHPFMTANNNSSANTESIGGCYGKKRPVTPNSYGATSGKNMNPMMWSDDLRLQEPCLGQQRDHHESLFKSEDSMDGGPGLDSISDIYDTKPVLPGDDHLVGADQKSNLKMMTQSGTGTGLKGHRHEDQHLFPQTG